MGPTVRNVILIGASGNIGLYILKELLSHPDHLKVTVLTRATSTATFPDGVRVVRSDYSRASLEEAFKGQNVALSFLNYDVSVDQKLIIDAAIKAGVDRFVPSDYGVRTYHPLYNVGVATYKRQFVEYLESKQDSIGWTAIICNPWIEYCLLDGLLGFDLDKQEAGIIDGGESPFSGSTRPYIARAVGNLLIDSAAYNHSKNQYVHLAGHTLTQNKLVSILEQLTGKQWKKDHVKSSELIERGHKLIADGSPWGMAFIVRAVTCSQVDGEVVGDLRKQNPWDKRLGLRLDDLETDLRDTLDGKYPVIHMPPTIIPGKS
ncbi:hypothetical protein TW65_07934 [Stemphylium lycopersici]|uniref:NAD(P)-binding protein n=1 Tax=Stemphylium lycopersici TaxID=183478 RepID=A0A364MWA5_STELY|nr:hypothetical protein TW65_07934 [Stemphylium lycopersici]RAR05066.1 NAD(P)-binding protein [Stemphylium lycopersici]